QGTQIDDCLGAGSTMPGERHGSSVSEKASKDVERDLQRSEFGAARHCTPAIKEEERPGSVAGPAGLNSSRKSSSCRPGQLHLFVRTRAFIVFPFHLPPLGSPLGRPVRGASALRQRPV